MKTKMLFTALLLIALASGNVHAAEQPNVVILFTDDQGTLDVNCYGAKDLETPHMDRLAATGVRFTQAYAHTVCCPARAALLTGRHPQRSGIDSWTQGDRKGSDGRLVNMPTSEVTLAEALRDAGYDTALFGKWHLGAKVGHGPLDQGFDRFFGHLSGFIDNYAHCFLHGEGYHDLYAGEKEIFRKGEYYPEMMVGEALKYLDERRDEPFFMMVSFNVPHYPEQPIGKFADAYSDMEMPRQSYARMVSSVDDLIGRVLGKLDETGLRENTIIVMMSDNGHSAEDQTAGIKVDNHVSGYPKGHYYGAHGGGGYTGRWMGHKGTFYEGGVRVPAIISYPKKVPQGEVRGQIVTVMDWFPTVLEMAGVSRDDLKLDGKSMMQVIRDAKAKSAHDVLHFGWTNKWAVREGDWKLMIQLNKKTRSQNIQLVNLADEEPERKDYSKEKPEVCERLMKLHEVWMADVYSNRAD